MIFALVLLLTADAARDAYYAQAFPKARFVAKEIPRAMLPPQDKENATYVEARDKKGTLLGYLRDFTGAVTQSDACACSPMSLTLVFHADTSFKTLLTPTPLEKLGHAAMDQADLARLIMLAKDPPAGLMAERRPENLVDAITGATKKVFEPHVVELAALSTHRVLKLVEATQKILKGAPLAWDRQRLQAILDATKDPQALASALVAFLPEAQSDETKEQVYRAIGQRYLEALEKTRSLTDASIEAALMTPPGAMERRPTLQDTCYRFADRGVAPSFVKRCIDELEQLKSPGPVLDRLRGAWLVFQNRLHEAEPYLKRAAAHFAAETDPAVHLRYVQAAWAAGLRHESCASAEALFLLHPLFPHAERALGACPDGVLGTSPRLRAEQRQKLLAAMITISDVPALSVDDSDLRTIDLALADLARPARLTIVVFFATWCPHCQVELPRLSTFARRLARSPWQDRVRIVGIRTSVERETESYEAFVAKFQPPFLIYTDATMSMAFARFAKHAGIRPALPALAVIDTKGTLRSLLPPGDYNDTAQELLWIVEALAAETTFVR